MDKQKRKFPGLDVEIEKAQRVQLEILLEFDRICQKYAIPYQLFSGTLIGAVRHKGFIPWDDDVDVCLLRKDYDRFLEVAQAELEPRYFLQNYQTDPAFQSQYSKIRKNGTLYVEKLVQDVPMHQGIFIDVFPMDDVRPGTWKGQLQRKLIHRLKIINYCRVKRVNEAETNPAVRKAKETGRYLLKVIPKPWMDRLITKLSTMENGKGAEEVAELGISTSPEMYRKFTIPKLFMKESILGEFEGYYFPIPKDYDAVLSSNYGNYLKVPSKEAQEPHHGIIEVDFGQNNQPTSHFTGGRNGITKGARRVEEILVPEQEVSRIRSVISRLLNIPEEQVQDIQYLEKGMTNHSYLFNEGKDQYIIRMPGEGTEQLVNRKNEAIVYDLLKGKNISDEIVYFSGESGIKITKYWANARNCDPDNKENVRKSMKKLKKFHDLRLEVPHTFDLFKEMEGYEALWNGHPSMFPDYEKTKKLVTALKPIIEALPKDWHLTHIDSNPDNILFFDGKVRLIDWEYSAMQDPHVDLAMFAIYSGYDREQTDKLIDLYFEGNCHQDTRMKIYAYMAVSGLLWSNWCEYKAMYGIDFGNYTILQYEYAKSFAPIVLDYFRESRRMEAGGEYD